MNKLKKTFYVTTPIYYVTAKPHLGTLYSTLIADVVARWQRMLGNDVFFLTGTDEHGQKVAQAAAQAAKPPKEFVDSFIPAYKDLWKEYELGYSHFIRTTDKAHEQTVEKIIKKLIARSDIYKSTYHGWYCTPCETFVTEAQAQVAQAPLCPQCQRQTTAVSEESYFFKLSAYQDKLLAFYEQHKDWIVPQERSHEVMSFVKSGLKDLSISRMRSKVSWGIPFPGDDEQVVYVWIDALANYISAVGYMQPGHEQEFARWWPANVQILGKDIIRFHAVYWPAFLMALELELPRKLLVHGWIKVDEKKMSKSLGNVIDPHELSRHFGVEPIRYYLMRQIPVNQDGNFSIIDVEQHIAADLADSLGNLLNRMTMLALQHQTAHITAPRVWTSAAQQLQSSCHATVQEYQHLMSNYSFHHALARLWEFIDEVNKFFHEQEPWKVVKEDREKFLEIIAATAHSLRTIAYLLWPIMPSKTEQLLGALGCTMRFGEDMITPLCTDEWRVGMTLRQIEVLFEKPEVGVYEKSLENKEKPIMHEYISIEDVMKIQLMVGTIRSCESLEKSDKLYKLEVDFGDFGKRQILAGVKKFFTPEQLVEKQTIFIFNLAPRKMMGLESQGMMLVVEDAHGKLQMTTIGVPVPNGTRLR